MGGLFSRHWVCFSCHRGNFFRLRDYFSGRNILFPFRCIFFFAVRIIFWSDLKGYFSSPVAIAVSYLLFRHQSLVWFPKYKISNQGRGAQFWYVCIFAIREYTEEEYRLIPALRIASIRFTRLDVCTRFLSRTVLLFSLRRVKSAYKVRKEWRNL